MGLSSVSSVEINRMIATSSTLTRCPGWKLSRYKIIVCYKTAIEKKYLDPKTTLEAYTVSLRGKMPPENFAGYLDRLTAAMRGTSLSAVQAIAPIHKGLSTMPIPQTAPSKAVVIAPKAVSKPVTATDIIASNKTLEIQIKALTSKIDSQNKDIANTQATVNELARKVKETQANNVQILKLLAEAGL